MAATNAQPYTVAVYENDRLLDRRPIADPFINTHVLPRGPLAALRVLFGRYRIEVRVRADRATEERVLELDPDYLGAWGSERRRAWNQQLNAALGAFADGLPV